MTPLRLVQRVSVDVDAARQVLAERNAGWLGTPVPAVREGSRRFLTDLALPLREHATRATFHRAAFVDLGGMCDVPGGCEIAIEWRSASLAPLFPVFAGHLLVTSSELRLEGYYAPPGGELGVILDRAFLNIAARGTARWFLAKVATALESLAGKAEG